MARILVTGGAGYIGSHTLRQLLANGDELVVVDDLSSGHRQALPPEAHFIEMSLADRAGLTQVLAQHQPDAVIHFAGAIEAGESMTEPRRFYERNVVNGFNLLDAILDTRIVPVVFSSTAAVYGEPPTSPITEDAAKIPTNVYGESKLFFETVLAAYDHAYGLRSISLRYFNACGAAADGSIGADHRHKTHLVTVAMLAALGQRPAIQVFGEDYPTPDGTCIRDYIHVDDLASAHLLAVRALFDGAATSAYNVGLGRGFSVNEVLDFVDRVTQTKVTRVPAPRRAGDPSELVADPSRLTRDLGWTPRYTDLDAIVQTAWTWHSTHPQGFSD